MLARMALTETKTPESKTGAVVRPVNYPATIVAMVSEEMKAEIVSEAHARRVSQGVVAREWLERGRP